MCLAQETRDGCGGREVEMVFLLGICSGGFDWLVWGMHLFVVTQISKKL